MKIGMPVLLRPFWALVSDGSAINPNRTNITFGVSGNQLNLSWPASHLGWLLQTNAVGVAATNQWFTYPGSASLNNLSIPINPSKSNVFFRLKLP